MAYMSEEELKVLGFKSLGDNVKISNKASIYNPEEITIGDNSRIDDFCVVSGRVEIGSYCHITPMCLIAGGESGVFLSDYCTLAYGVKVFSQSDDYSGKSMVNSLIPKKYKSEIYEKVTLERHVIVGAGSIIMPGAYVAEGCSIGAMSLINRSTKEWGIYIGIPAKRLKERSRDLLGHERQFKKELKNNDTV